MNSISFDVFKWLKAEKYESETTVKQSARYI